MSEDDHVDTAAGGNTKTSRERKRRELIKESFTNLKDSIPSLRDEKLVSHAKILRSAAEFIQQMKNKNDSHQQDIDNLSRQNDMWEYQINQLKSVKGTSKYTIQHSNLALVVSESDNTDESEGDLEKSKTATTKKS